MKKYTHIFFGLCIVIFVIHQYLQSTGITSAFFNSYLDPLLIMPILLHSVAIERRFISGQQKNLPLIHILGYFIIVSVIGEEIFPLLNEKHIADPIDILFYLAGAFLYAVVQYFTVASTKTDEMQRK